MCIWIDADACPGVSTGLILRTAPWQLWTGCGTHGCPRGSPWQHATPGRHLGV